MEIPFRIADFALQAPDEQGFLVNAGGTVNVSDPDCSWPIYVGGPIEMSGSAIFSSAGTVTITGPIVTGTLSVLIDDDRPASILSGLLRAVTEQSVRPTKTATILSSGASVKVFALTSTPEKESLTQSYRQHWWREIAKPNSAKKVIAKSTLARLELQARFADTTESSTSIAIAADGFQVELSRILLNAKDEEFEFGVESALAVHLKEYVDKYRADGIEVLSKVLALPTVSPQVVGESLAILGQIVDSKTYTQRVQILEESLSSNRAAIRRGAIVGLAYLDDPAAMPQLRHALEIERVGWVRNYITATLRQLQQTLDGNTSKAVQKKEPVA